MSERDQHNRWRCIVTGCNPVMKSAEAMESHQAETGHRTAKWPIRSATGKAKARARNKTGYYDKYNVGAKSAWARGLSNKMPRASGGYGGYEVHPFSDEAFSEGM